MDRAAELQSLLNGLLSESEAGKRTKQQLLDLAAELGLDTTGCRTKSGLIELVSSPVDALLRLHAINVLWKVERDSRFDALVYWDGAAVLVRVDDDVSVEAASSEASAELLGDALERQRGEVIDVEADGIEPGAFLAQLDAHLADFEGELYDSEGQTILAWRLKDGSVAWIPEEAFHGHSYVLVAHWDFLGPGESTPISDNPGTVYAHSYRGYLLCTHPAAEQKHVGRLPSDDLNAESLRAALGDFFEYFVGSSTFSLDIAVDLDADGIRSLLGSASGIGGLWVNGRWWYETPEGWSDQTLESLPAPALDKDAIVAIHLVWLYPAFDGTVDLLLFDEADPSLRMALCTLAAHKADGWQREAVAWTAIQLADGRELVGVATPNASLIAGVAGVEPAARIDLKSNMVDFHPSRIETDDLFVSEKEEVGVDPFWEAIRWLQTRSGSFPPTPRSTSDEDDGSGPSLTANPSHEASGSRIAPFPPPRPRPPVPPFRRLADLEAGDEGFVFADAVGQDAHGRIWIDPQAPVRRAGIPAEDPFLEVESDGTIVVSTSRLQAPLPPPQRRHSVPTGDESA